LPNKHFQKEWQIKNTGKLAWSSNAFPVKLQCIGGTILNGMAFAGVPSTQVGETASISVDLVAPAYPGNYFIEWVLNCNGFQFGPRVWCTIQVEAPEPEVSFDSIVIQNDSERVLVPNSQSEFEMNIQAASSTKNDTENEENNDAEADDDDFEDEDEFVVVPDCFDLSKKWTPKTSEANSLSTKDESTKAEEAENRNEEEEEDQEKDDHVLVSRSSSFCESESEMIMLNCSASETATICNENNVNVNSNEEEEKEETEQEEEASKTEINSDESLPVNEEVVVENKTTTESIQIKRINVTDEDAQIDENISRSFDKIQAAFSNLKKSSFVRIFCC
jgi:hypothetical protein